MNTSLRDFLCKNLKTFDSVKTSINYTVEIFIAVFRQNPTPGCRSMRYLILKNKREEEI